jgi:hypothetical protein
MKDAAKLKIQELANNPDFQVVLEEGRKLALTHLTLAGQAKDVVVKATEADKGAGIMEYVKKLENLATSEEE